MRNLLLCSVFLTGCYDFAGLSKDKAPVVTGDAAVVAHADLAHDHTDGDVEGDGATPSDDLAGVDLTSSPADMASCTQYTHSNGVGGTWTDCVPLHTYNAAQAIKACLASFPAGPCVSPPDGGECSGDGIAYTMSTGGWTVFVYDGGLQGLVVLPSGNCAAPGSTVAWN